MAIIRASLAWQPDLGIASGSTLGLACERLNRKVSVHLFYNTTFARVPSVRREGRGVDRIRIREGDKLLVFIECHFCSLRPFELIVYVPTQYVISFASIRNLGPKRSSCQTGRPSVIQRHVNFPLSRVQAKHRCSYATAVI